MRSMPAIATPTQSVLDRTIGKAPRDSPDTRLSRGPVLFRARRALVARRGPSFRRIPLLFAAAVVIGDRRADSRFIPSVRVATVQASDATVLVTVARNHLRVLHCEYVRPARAAISTALRRHRRSRERGAVCWPRSSRLSSIIRSPRRRPRWSKLGRRVEQGASKPELGAGDVGPGPGARRKRLGHPRSRAISTGSASCAGGRTHRLPRPTWWRSRRN